MRHQELRRLQSIVVHDAPDRAAAKVHIALRFNQPNVITMELDLAIVRIEFLFIAKTAAILRRQRVHKPKTGVVQSALVFFLRVTEAGDNSNYVWHSMAMLNKKTARWRSFCISCERDYLSLDSSLDASSADSSPAAAPSSPTGTSAPSTISSSIGAALITWIETIP